MKSFGGGGASARGPCHDLPSDPSIGRRFYADGRSDSSQEKKASIACVLHRREASACCPVFLTAEVLSHIAGIICAPSRSSAWEARIETLLINLFSVCQRTVGRYTSRLALFLDLIRGQGEPRPCVPPYAVLAILTWCRCLEFRASVDCRCRSWRVRNARLTVLTILLVGELNAAEVQSYGRPEFFYQ